MGRDSGKRLKPRAVSAESTRIRNGNDRKDRQGSQDAQVQDPPAQPLPAVRPAARLHAEVRDVPPLLPEAGARRRCDGCDEELLVNPKAQIPKPKSQFGIWLGFGIG